MNSAFLLSHLSEKSSSPYAPISGTFIMREGQRDVFLLPPIMGCGSCMLPFSIDFSVPQMILVSIQNYGSHYDIIIQVCHRTFFIFVPYYFLPLDFFLTSNSLLPAFMPCPPNSPAFIHPPYIHPHLSTPHNPPPHTHTAPLTHTVKSRFSV